MSKRKPTQKRAAAPRSNATDRAAQEQRELARHLRMEKNIAKLTRQLVNAVNDSDRRLLSLAGFLAARRRDEAGGAATAPNAAGTGTLHDRNVRAGG